MRYKPLPIGIDNFEELIVKNYYYVDKTLLIKQLLDGGSKVTLFTRPRRFGKSLNLSMLQYFFEKSEEDKSYLFEGLQIIEAGDRYTEHMGKYPVIMLSFKEAKQDDFTLAYHAVCEAIAEEFQRHSHILDLVNMTEKETEVYKMIANNEAEQKVMLSSIKFLTKCLEKAYGEKVIILIDEYDVPIENAYFRDFDDEMIGFIRGILSAALKTNTSLEMAVMTGCLRISKESIFTGLNNLEIVSIENREYGEYFGFTEDEVECLLNYYQKIHHMELIKQWYNGYLFGITQVYNPWSLINHMKKLLVNDKEMPKPYWSNTSSNTIVKELIEKIDLAGKLELETLMAGGTIEKPIHEEITYGDIDASTDNLWNFLYFTGYLKKVSDKFEVDTNYATLQIPNTEVGYIYKNQIKEWSRKQVGQTNLSTLYEATMAGDTATMEKEIKKVLIESISYYDTSHKSGDYESFYHGLILGIYRGMKQYIPFSNRESGNGRPDLILKSPDIDQKAFVFEFKITEMPSKLTEVAESAFAQIEKEEYRTALYAEGYEDVAVYGIGFYKKNCRVVNYSLRDNQ